MAKYKVVITDREYENIDQEREILRCIDADVVECHSQDPEKIVQMAWDADALIVQFAPITREIISSLQKCKIIAKYATGIDGVDLQAATERGIRVTNVRDYCKEEVSDQALAFLLLFSRQILPYRRYVQAGNWYGKPWPCACLQEQTVGIVSFGRIARRFAEKVKPLCGRVWAYDAYVSDEEIRKCGVEPKRFSELLAGSDYISVHCPLNEQTYHLFDRQALEQMKPSAFLINVARGALVDQEALVWALDNHIIAGAAVDVLEQEPPVKNFPLLQRDAAIITPHMGWYSDRAQHRLQATPAEEVVRCLRGEPLKNLVNVELDQ